MCRLGDLYFVQRSDSRNPARGWDTFWVSTERDASERMAGNHEQAVVWVDGENVTDRGVTIARVRTTDEILDESGVDGLIAALVQTRIQLQELLAGTD
jgi:hypothetical protein